MTYVHLNFFFDRPFDGDTADAIQRFFSTYLVAWAPHLAIHRAGSLSGEIDATEPGSLYSAVAAVGLERGKLFQELTTKYGPGWQGRESGSVELHGSDRRLVAVIAFDLQETFHKIGANWIWANSLALHFEDEADSVVEDVFENGCRLIKPACAYGSDREEQVAKNMDTSSGMRAIGIDISKHLPGIYWRNYFGPPYVELITENKLLTAPSTTCEKVGNGVLVRLSKKSFEWKLPEYEAVQDRVLAHLGPQFFFDRRDPDRPCEAPKFGFPKQQHSGVRSVKVVIDEG